MRYIIVTGGPLPQESAKLIKELSASDEDTILIACDGGCDILARNNIVPDLVVGDMDSISEEGLGFINSHNVFIEKYPVEKDWTDSEIALGKTGDEEVILVTPDSGRLDHVIANLQLALKFKSEGKKITITDEQYAKAIVCIACSVGFFKTGYRCNYQRSLLSARECGTLCRVIIFFFQPSYL